MSEITGAQVTSVVSYETGVPPISYKKRRQMRKDPVISLVRKVFFAGVYEGDWSYEGENQEHVDFIREQLEPLRRFILATGSLGCFDYGWQPYEKVFEVSEDGSMIVLKKLKQLSQDQTEVLTDEASGAFKGLKQGMVELPVDKCLLLAFDVEGTNWTGQASIDDAEKPYDEANTLARASRRYDAKMAGAHWVVYYPDGSTKYNGTETPNSEIAEKLLKSLQASGMIAVPLGKTSFQQGTENSWRIELVTAKDASVEFTNRFDYYDKQKVRALGFPERSILEGDHGTKAEAETHGDFVITLIEYRHACILELINWHLVNQLLDLNFGPEFRNTVTVKASPLHDGKRAVLKALYDKVLSNADGFIREVDRIDTDAITDALGIPTIEQVDKEPLPLPTSKEPTPAPDPTEQPKPEDQQ